MPRFFSDVQGPTALITGKDVNHITGPLRKQIGDELLIRDAGQGFRARITSISKADVSLDIIERQELEDRGSRQLHLAVSIIDLKDMDDLMRLVSELGVASIHPVIAERSNIRDISQSRMDRWTDIIRESVKQTQRKSIPVVEAPVTLNGLLRKNTFQGCEKYFASIESGMKISEIDADKILLAIGPEGGFTQSEKAALEGLSFIPVNMGKTTLRTVAAAAAAAAVLCM